MWVVLLWFGLHNIIHMDKNRTLNVYTGARFYMRAEQSNDRWGTATQPRDKDNKTIKIVMA